MSHVNKSMNTPPLQRFSTHGFMTFRGKGFWTIAIWASIINPNICQPTTTKLFIFGMVTSLSNSHPTTNLIPKKHERTSATGSVDERPQLLLRRHRALNVGEHEVVGLAGREAWAAPGRDSRIRCSTTTSWGPGTTGYPPWARRNVREL